MHFTWHATKAPPRKRYDDFRMLTPEIGWAINGAGEIIHTKDGFETFETQLTVEGDVWLRCMSITSPTDGWVGTLTRRQRLWRTQDGKNWTDITSTLPPIPHAVCGIHSPSRNVVYASGTQYPRLEAAIMRTMDGGQTWTSISMARHANLLIDNFFVDDLHGWVVGGKGGTHYPDLTPVVLFTADGGQTWEDRAAGIDFPKGEWGWKIQFLNAQVGFVSLENTAAAAILKTTDGGLTWRRIEVKDPQRNVDLEGIGFIDEMVGWVGGWGHGYPDNPTGTTSGTTDGGVTWFNANDVGRFINRFRFFPGGKPIAGYASGGTVYQCIASDTPDDAREVAARFSATREAPLAKVWTSLDVKADVPANAQRLTITVFDPRQKLVKVLADEKAPRAGARTYAWDFKDEEGEDSGTGHFITRVLIDGKAESDMVVRPARSTPEELAKQVADMITRIAPIALRGHDELTLPDASGTPVTLKSLFHKPRDLMAALVRGGWVIPEVPDRSMLLVAIIETGPMQGILAPADVQLLSDWITAGAVIPPASP